MMRGLWIWLAMKVQPYITQLEYMDKVKPPAYNHLSDQMVNLQEEVFMLRDEVAGFANFFGLNVVGTEVFYQKDESREKEMATAMERVRSNYDEMFINSAAESLVVTMAAVEARRTKRDARKKGFSNRV